MKSVRGKIIPILRFTPNRVVPMSDTPKDFHIFVSALIAPSGWVMLGQMWKFNFKRTR